MYWAYTCIVVGTLLLIRGLAMRYHYTSVDDLYEEARRNRMRILNQQGDTEL